MWQTEVIEISFAEKEKIIIDSKDVRMALHTPLYLQLPPTVMREQTEEKVR